MLVISRFPSECFFIGPDIRIELLSVRYFKACVGVFVAKNPGVTHVLKHSEMINLGGGVSLMICEFRGLKARFGVSAPPELSIQRDTYVELPQA